ncbi:MAG TPA: DNA adenine methylase, partial [Ilumatobacteraceae bacterium]|nr:DNA adenine methylase [Ilumatobacteraceae bacterium]
FAGSPLHPILLTSLIVAADKVDSTTGVQMAYLKQWAPRSYADLQLMMPELIAGAGHTVRGDAHALAGSLGDFDLAYLDPPYNNHRYFTNYHIFETLVTWDRPDHYGVACKRTDSRSETTRSVFNAKRSMPSALAATIAALRAGVVIVSYNNESWLSLDDLRDMCRVHGHVEVLAFDSKRYIGAQIGIHNPAGQRVGQVSHLHNLEYVVIAGPRATVTRMAAAFPTAHLST